MSQRSIYIEKEITIELKLKVKLISFSNHDGFSEGQIEKSINEFEEEISSHLIGKIRNEYFEDNFICSSDMVHYEIL